MNYSLKLMLSTILIVCILQFNEIEATVFSGGSMSYRILTVNSEYAKIRFFHKFIKYGIDSNCAENCSSLIDGNPIISKFKYENETLDGTQYIDGSFYCDSFDSNKTLKVYDEGSRETELILPISSDNKYEFSYEKCCSLSNIVTYSNKISFKINVDLNNRSDDDQKINQPPEIYDVSLYTIFVNGLNNTHTVTVADSDNDVIRCFWVEENNSIIKSFNLNSSTCTISYNGQLTAGTYSVALLVKDFDQSDENFLKPFSEVPVFIVINVVRSSSFVISNETCTQNKPPITILNDFNISDVVTTTKILTTIVSTSITDSLSSKIISTDTTISDSSKYTSSKNFSQKHYILFNLLILCLFCSSYFNS